MKALRELRVLLAGNGPVWTACFVVERSLSNAARVFDAKMFALEQRHGLPGLNTVRRNFELWEGFDWSLRGEEWSHSEEWKQALVDEVMTPYLQAGEDVLEIGPGGGRWTEALQPRAGRLVLVDLSERCIELCKQRFADCENVEYFVNDGSSLEFLADESIDFIWSFDVFVHINPADTQAYLGEFRRILRDGGRAVIHHAGAGRSRGGYRSSMTAELFIRQLREAGLRFLRQFDSWGPEGQFDVGLHSDVISVFSK